MQFAGILQSLVIVEESADEHAVQTVLLFNAQVKVAHQEVSEVVARHFEEQLVLVDRVGLVDEEEQEIGVSLGRQRVGARGVIGDHGDVASRPDVAQVELPSV